MIVARPQILPDEWMLIERQEDAGCGGRIDLLALAPDASVVLIELKRDRTPRDVVAQAIDYASWVEKLRVEDIAVFAYGSDQLLSHSWLPYPVGAQVSAAAGLGRNFAA